MLSLFFGGIGSMRSNTDIKIRQGIKRKSASCSDRIELINEVAAELDVDAGAVEAELERLIQDGECYEVEGEVCRNYA